jgi:hypothetical protein
MPIFLDVKTRNFASFSGPREAIVALVAWDRRGGVLPWTGLSASLPGGTVAKSECPRRAYRHRGADGGWTHPPITSG